MKESSEHGVSPYKKLLDAAKDPDLDKRAEGMARESHFYSGEDPETGKPVRNWERIERNHCGALGLPARGDACRTSLARHYNKTDPDGDKNSYPDWLKQPLADARKARPSAELEPVEPTKEKPEEKTAKPVATKLNDGEIKKLGASLIQPGDEVDESLLKSDLTEDELSNLMNSRPYLSISDPRHEAVQGKVKSWHEDRWGTAPAKIDATGRMVLDERSRNPAPTFSTIPVVQPTGHPLGEALSRIANTVMDRANKTSAPDAVRTLQSTLNDQDDPLARPVPTLKTDGIAGPKTRRALRFATSHIGADRLLSGFSGRGFR